MARYKVILQFDGSDFCGFQKQKQSRTVQGIVESALRLLGWKGTSILAAGRTDSGVHATGQVIAFDLDWKHSPKDLLRALNSHLPYDVAGQSVSRVLADFHPRYSAQGRRYKYRLFCDETRQPLKERYSWRIWPPVDLHKMQEAANYLQGTHDFGAYGSPIKPGGSTIRTIKRVGWFEEGSDMVFEIVGDAFLYHMVRRLVFVQSKIGQEEIQLEKIEGILSNKDFGRLQGLAPASGLTLVEVLYPPDIYLSGMQ
ncbi:MAG: tRNA pseudouridine(38-40) synthase TruA [Anaerolineales bacterium]|nr:tRNA pseudouridine(38-40) synthase TruA [Anaerolineales bacterium]